MSYCWRLQYYCKLGAAHGAWPIYYVSRLPQHAHKFRNQLRVLALPRVSMGAGHAGSGYDTTLCHRQERWGAAFTGGKGSIEFVIVPGGHWWAE